jgi:CHAT domain-containing protein/uncharacterized protein HemY
MKNIILCSILLFLKLSLSAQTIQEQIKLGDDLYYAGKYEEAIAIYKKAIDNKAYPHDTAYANLLQILGWAYIDEAAYSKAEPLFIEGKNINEKILGKENADYAYSCAALSLLYYYQGNYAKAEPLCIEAKNIREKVIGKENTAYANSCKNLADIYYDKRNYAKAEPLYLEALGIRERKLGKDAPEYISLCNTIAGFYHDQGMYTKAEPYYLIVKNGNEKSGGKENKYYARSCHNLALLYMDQGLYTKAEPLLLESNTILGKIFGRESADYANSCSSLGNLYLELNQYSKAESLFIEAKNIFAKLVGKEHADYAMSCNNLGGLYRTLGLYEKAEALYKEVKKIEEKRVGKDHPDYAKACNNLGSLYGAQALFSKAEPLFLEAKNIYEKTLGKNHTDYILSCNNLGSLYLDQGHYAKAEKFYVESKNIREKVLGKNHPDYAISCNSLANLYTDQGMYSKAEPLYIEAKNIYEKTFGKNNLKYASVCNNLGNLYYSQELFDKAESLYLEAKAIQEKVAGKNHPAYAMSVNNIGSVYYRQGMYAKAEPFYLEALDIQARNLGKEHPDYAMSCNNVAGLYKKQRNYTKAEAMYIESKNIREKVYGKDHPAYAHSCFNLGNLYTITKQYNKAGALLKESVQNKLKQIDDVLPALSEKERDEFYKSIDFYFLSYYEFVLKANDPFLYADLFNLQLRIKGLIFQSTQKMQRQIMGSGNASLIRKYEDWKNLKIQLNYYMQLTLADRTARKINTDSLNTVINDLEKTLSLESEVFAKSMDKKKYTWQDIQKRLLTKEAAVEIVRTDSAYIALIVKPYTIEHPDFVVIKNIKDFEKRYLKYYRSSIEHKTEDLLSYNNFWLQIQEKLGTVSKVYLSGDGVYHQINLMTLKNPVSNNYLLTETSIQLTSNLKDLMTVDKARLPEQFEKYKIHLIAYPKYDGGVTDQKTDLLKENNKLKSDTSQRFYGRGGAITMLPGTKVEAGNIVSLCNQLNIKPEVKLLEEASESYIKSLNNPTILHIATHGFFLPSGEINENARSLSREEAKTYATDPLMNSGLLLANAQQGMKGLIINGEDGVLTAKEALNLNLDQTDLVIMSACETGLGEIRNGEGVYGLQRSFQQAGARTVIISLWKVSDEATQELMSNFYNNLLVKKMLKREAFKQAQSSLIQKYPDPYFWGAFVMVGE